jgi:hypothetical protein
MALPGTQRQTVTMVMQTHLITKNADELGRVIWLAMMTRA